MADISGDGGGVVPDEVRAEAVAVTPTSSQPLGVTVSGSFKEGKSSSRRRASVRPSLDANEFLNLLHGSDPVKVELNRLENEVRDKDRELSEAQAEIKALKLSERQREKAVEEKALKLKELTKRWKKNNWPQKPEDTLLFLGLIDVKIILWVLRMTR